MSCDAMCCYGGVTSHPGLIRKALITNLLQLETFSLTERDSHRAATHRVLTERSHTHRARTHSHTVRQRKDRRRHRTPPPRTTSSLSTKPTKPLSSEPTELAAHGSQACCPGPSTGPGELHSPITVSLALTRFYVHGRLQGFFTFFLYVVLQGG